ncbi:sugar phosphate isomerase/epimerase [Acinetobacter sp. S40]|uniref:sugar phosphate isomerase/epimerase family protein n=1 Tax=unclassified Acinetobacter TaxID=196816 RepID=UPI00190B3E9F|nr:MULTISPECIES: TIM barrel protein [unclassified Acinetobacter]MBJ9984920.1 sugar phosphate isomerase/epimerase [Acinetobacter sp. S40]MBK0063089.1 sugar phosphate isomerase/epimerase [Acinetobacter sp. S55]MBK0066493.1 sugar phosphate isomerase/epimerase [Acinetobacter sp. S54]
MQRKYSLSFLTVADVSPVEAVKIAAECGYAAVGLRLLPAAPNEADYPILIDPALLKETKAALQDTDVQVADVEIIRIEPEFEPKKYLQFLDVAQQLGAKHILIAGNDPEHGRLIQNFAQFCELSKQYGLSCDLEFMPWTDVKNLLQAEQIVKASGQDNAAILIDSLHFDRSDSTLEQIKALNPQYLNYVQLCDGFAKYDPSDTGLIKIARSNRLVPGQGEIDLISLIRALPENITLAAEVPNLILAERPALERAQINLNAMKQLVAEAQQNAVTG